MTVVVLKAVFDPLRAYLDFLLFIDDISGSFQFQGFLTGLFSRRERHRVPFSGTCIASETRAIFKLFYFIYFRTRYTILFKPRYFKYYFLIALRNNIVNFFLELFSKTKIN